MKPQLIFGKNRMGNDYYLWPAVNIIINRMGFVPPFKNPVRDIGLHLTMWNYHFYCVIKVRRTYE